MIELQKEGGAAGAGGLPLGLYRIQAEAVNWLGKSANATFTFEKKAAPVPVIGLRGESSPDSPREFVVSQGVVVETTLEASTICNGVGVSYSWSQVGGNSTVTGLIMNKKDLIIPPGGADGLIPGTLYEFELTVELAGQQGLQGEKLDAMRVFIMPTPSPLQARVEGPGSDFPDDEELILNASASHDPDARGTSGGDGEVGDDEMGFSWTCARDDKRPCFAGTENTNLASNRTPHLKVAPFGMEEGHKHHFTVTIRKSKRTATATIDIRVVRGVPGLPSGIITRECPEKKNRGCNELHNPDRDLRLRLDLGFEDTQIEWSSPQLDLTRSGATDRTGINSRYLLVDHSYLTSGADYTFEALLTRGGASRRLRTTVRSLASIVSATASAGVRTNALPVCSRAPCFGVEPRSGIELGGTTFTLSAQNWVDNEDLTYTFGEIVDGRKIEFVTQSSRAYKNDFLVSGNRTLYTCAVDPFGGRACAEVPVVVSPVVIEPSKSFLEDLTADLEKSARFGDDDAMVPTLSATISPFPVSLPELDPLSPPPEPPFSPVHFH